MEKKGREKNNNKSMVESKPKGTKYSLSSPRYSQSARYSHSHSQKNSPRHSRSRPGSNGNLPADSKVHTHTKHRPKFVVHKAKKILAIWERSYVSVSYVVYIFSMFFAIFYLGYIFGVQADRKLLLNYKPVKEYMGLNSYSLLTPLLSIILAMLLGYSTKSRVRLSDGDFFGTLGVILFLTCITLHDAVGIQRLQLNKNMVLEEPKYTGDECSLSKEVEKPSEWKTWESAWSTRPSCVKVYKEHKVDDPIPSDAVLDWIDTTIPDVVLLYPTSSLSPALGSEEYKFDHLINKTRGDPACCAIHGREPVSRPRLWMQAMQIDLKCCGPYANISKWKELVLDSMCDNGVTQSCGVPFIDYINRIFHWTEIIMFTEATLLLFMVVLYTVHFVVMKKEKVKISKAFSLLRITSLTVLHGYQDIHREHHLQTQHYKQHLHYTGHPHYHRHPKKHRIQSIVADQVEVIEPPRLENYMHFPPRDKEHEELEAMFLSKSVTNTNIPAFPRADSLEDPPSGQDHIIPLQRRRGHSFATSKATVHQQTPAEARMQAQIRASRAMALAEWSSSDDNKGKASTSTKKMRGNETPERKHRKKSFGNESPGQNGKRSKSGR